MSSLYPTAERLEAQRGQAQVETLSGTVSFVTYSAGSNQIELRSSSILADPGGAGRTVLLPAPGEPLQGVELCIVNTADAAEALTIESASGTTLVTAAQSETARVRCVKDGAASWDWYNVGLAKAT